VVLHNQGRIQQPHLALAQLSLGDGCSLYISLTISRSFIPGREVGPGGWYCRRVVRRAARPGRARNCGCDWDGGDCCGSDMNYQYCTKCECQDPDQQSGCDGTCAKPNWQGDGNCDMNNNICGCGWDGGDCCGDDKNYQYCGDSCACIDPDQQAAACTGTCAKPNWVGDGVCDANNNNCGCEYDGGDCCGSSSKGTQYSYCGDGCACADPDSTNYGDTN